MFIVEDAILLDVVTESLSMFISLCVTAEINLSPYLVFYSLNLFL